MSQFNPTHTTTNPTKSTEINRSPAYPARKHNRRERKLLQTAAGYTPTTTGDWAVAPAYVDDALDQIAAQTPKTVQVTWNFATNGGAIGTIPLGVTLPNNAIITSVVTDVTTATTGTATGTIQLNVPTDGNLGVATVSNNQTAEVVQVIPTSPTKLTGARQLQATIATQTFTAGVITWSVTYITHG